MCRQGEGYPPLHHFFLRLRGVDGSVLRRGSTRPRPGLASVALSSLAAAASELAERELSGVLRTYHITRQGHRSVYKRGIIDLRTNPGNTTKRGLYFV